MKMPEPPSKPALTPEEEAAVDELVTGHDAKWKRDPDSQLVTYILYDHSQAVRDAFAARLKASRWVLHWQNPEHLQVSKPRA